MDEIVLKHDFHKFKEQLQLLYCTAAKFDEKSDSDLTIDDFENVFKSNDKIIVTNRTIKMIIDDCKVYRETIENDENRKNTIQALRYSNRITRRLEEKLKALNIYDLKEISDYDFETIKNYKSKNNSNRLIGKKCFIELVELMIERDIGFKNMKPDKLKKQLDAYKMFEFDCDS